MPFLLPKSFVMQIALLFRERFAACVGLRPCRPSASLAIRRMRQCAFAYACALGTASLLAFSVDHERIQAFVLGLAIPGVGFLFWMDGGGLAPQSLALGSGALFAVSLALWFGTGNVVLPPLVWLGTAAAAALARDLDLVGGQAGSYLARYWLVLALCSGLLLPALVLRLSGGGLPRQWTDVPSVSLSRHEPTAASGIKGEIDLPTLQLQRLLLDRALQPVEAFEGFEWRDQFQTAAVRYQVNFISYALSVVQANRLPAFEGYMLEAQRRLLRKLSDHRMWRYWAAENAWGHFRIGADPVPRGNIMYTGFAAAQIAFAEAASGRSMAAGGRHLRLAHPGGAVFEYDLPDLVALLVAQYRRASWGLLACEPHWIYPLCNLITAAAIRTADARHGTDGWQKISQGFREGLEREFTTSDGRIVPFRSSLIGLALPSAGGTVMQAFPCCFLNGLFPDLAQQHWERVRADLEQRSWKRAFWPVDVGNYGFSRASNLAASAAAAVEMGDCQSATAMLEFLDRECPSVVSDGVAHRPRASLWSHALELSARCGGAGTIAELISRRPAPGLFQPHLKEVPYPDVLVARVVYREGRLHLVLYPGLSPCVRSIVLGGLVPGRQYQLAGTNLTSCRAGPDGTASVEVALVGRFELTVSPGA